MAVINTNVNALFSQMALGATSRQQSIAMQQLSTGKRINSARDDAAGMAIATRMTEQIRGLNQAVRNAGDAITLIQTAEGATNEITDMLQRMRELAVQASNDTNSNDQRSYLDLEFQQLKQQIVQIANDTEWNGFPVLNGTAGQAVGEQPIYKTVSNPQTNSIFISPSNLISAKDGNEGKTINGTVQAPMTVTEGSTASPNTNFTISPYKLSGVLSLQQDPTSGGVTASFLTSDNKTIQLQTTSTAAELQAGVVKFATTDASGNIIPGNSQVFNTVVDQNGNPVKDSHGSGGSQEYSGVQYTVTRNGSPVNLVSTANSGSNTDETNFLLNVQVNGSIPALPAGQLVINNVQIPASFAKDDTVSPPNNAAGSAIAKAAAINTKTDQTGVVAVVNENDMSGSAMNQLGTSAATGHLMINGVATATFTTSVNNPRESRATVIRAINLISDQTGVVAVDTGSDAQGIQLVAKDGRNIETQMVPTDGTTDQANFADRTGLRSGVQVGSYSLESKVTTNITVSAALGGDISSSGLVAGTYANQWTSDSQSHQSVNTATRNLVTSNPPAGANPFDYQPKVLNTGDLVINGVAIPGATADGDTLSGIESTKNTNNVRAASAIATATAINSESDKTGVHAVANANITQGNFTDVSSATNNGTVQKLYINGVEVDVPFGGTAGDASTTDSQAARAQSVVDAVNKAAGQTGVTATVNNQGGVSLDAADGRNLSVWYDSSAVTAGAFGLATSSTNPAPVSGVSGLDGTTNPVTATSSGADVQYSTVSLVSDKPITVAPGVNGYQVPLKDDGTQKTTVPNFTALGFQVGTYGGLVKDAQSLMAPPRVGRLSFQVGANANQDITIDLSDFGQNGPITGDITWDVNQAAPTPGTDINSAPGTTADSPKRSFISSQSAAEDVLARLDSVMNKVNATRANMGAVMNRLDHVINNLTNVSMNMSASQSQIQDADYASASTQLAKTQIMQQAATAVLAQANTSQQSVLKLLGG